MANKIRPKRSYTLNNVPGSLASGELAINANSSAPKIWIGNAAGTGNVLIASLSLSDMLGNTSNITEGSNLYYTDSRARASFSSSATGLTYTSGTGVFSFTSGYSIPATASQTNWDSAYTQRLQWDGGSTNLTAATGRTSLGATTIGSNLFTLTNPTAVTFPRFNADNTVSSLDAATFRSAIGAGTSSTTGTVTSVSMTVPTGLSVSGSPITSTGTLGVTFTAGYSIPTTTSQTNWDTAYSNRITSLTTTGSSGSATLVSNTLNIPTYTLSGLGGQASSTNLTSLSGLTYAATSFVKMTASGTFSLDTATYLTGNQTITLSGDVSGNGSTSISVTLGTVGISKGGTGQTTANAAFNALVPSQTSNSGKYLKTDGTNTSWAAVTGGSVFTTSATAPSSPTAGDVWFDTVNGIYLVYLNDGNSSQWVEAAGGSNIGNTNVTSVGLSLPSIFTVSNSPVTSSGTLTGTLASQTANYVFAAPNGSSGTPVFRALVSSDIPVLNQNTTGTSSNVTGTVAIANGGTGQTTATAAFNALAPSQASNSGKYLKTDGTNTSWATVTAGPMFTVSATAPVSPTQGDQWFDTDNGFLYQYINDGNTSQWIQIGGNTLTTGVPAGGTTNQFLVKGSNSDYNVTWSSTLNNPTILNYTETLFSPAANSAFTVDLTNGTIQKFTTNANTTITLPSSVSGKSFVLLVAYGGAHTITWAGGSTIKWPGGTAPTVTSVTNKIDIFSFFQDGTNTYGTSFGLNL